MKFKKILIIEDSEEDQFFSKRVIKKYDDSIEVLQAYDGKEALEILSSLDTLPDLIFLDINMPVMNGIEFLESYTQKGYTGSVVVMLTSSDNPRDKEQCSVYECVKEYLIKPLEGRDLAMLSSIQNI